jgi:geranylgeranyl pyrophosphate synthase
MDDDQVRRGRPALHVAFGEADALLASDALFALAFETFARSGSRSGAVRTAIAEIARTIGLHGVAQGQLLDLTRKKPCSRRLLRRIHLLKTARLISVSMKSGALLAGAGARIVNGLERAGTWLGMLFQITDDLLDHGREPDSSTRLTYPVLHGLGGARFRASAYQRLYRAEIARLRQALTRSGVQELLELADLLRTRGS